MPTMPHTIGGSIVPPRCLACLLLGLCLLPVAVPAAEGIGTPGAAFGTGEPRERIEHRLTDAERRRAEAQAAWTVEVSRGAFGAESLETPLSGTTWREEWEQRRQRKKAKEKEEKERPRWNLEAMSMPLFYVVGGYALFLCFVFALPVRLACREGKIPKIRWVEDDGGPPREEEGDAIPKKILEEYPEEIRDRLVVIYRCMPFWVRLGKHLARKLIEQQGGGMDNSTAPSADTEAQGQARHAAQASPPAAGSTSSAAGCNTEASYADWLRQRRRRKDKTD